MNGAKLINQDNNILLEKLDTQQQFWVNHFKNIFSELFISLNDQEINRRFKKYSQNINNSEL